MSSRRTALLLASALLTVPLPAMTDQRATAATTPAPDAIEEDWVLVMGNPDPIGIGPQITTVMSPVADDSSPFVAFDLNYQESPIFYPGGVQIQVWSSNQIIATSSQGTAVLNTPNESVTWTQRMALSGGSVNYAINNGTSITWGKFGQGSGTNLTVSFTTPLTSLAGYTPTVSTKRSGASWEKNLVTSLTLKQVRYYANNQLISTDTNPRVLVTSGN